MGPSQNKSSQLPKSLEPQHDIANGGNLTTLSQPPVEGVNVLSSRKKLNPLTSCPSSPNNPLDNPSAENDHKHDTSTSTAISPDLSSSSSSNLLITESPLMQVMERSTNKSDRIPSSVFDIDQSSDPLQWSIASSESLFSIHIGNMSISRDYNLWCSDERGIPGEASVDGPLHSTIHSPFRQVSDRTSVKLRAMETPLDTVKEDLRESEDQNREKSFAEGRGSSASVKSFAFPILTGDSDKDSPGKLGCSMRLIPEQQQPLPKQETEPLPQSKPKAPQTKQPVVQKKWFSCFPCCP